MVRLWLVVGVVCSLSVPTMADELGSRLDTIEQQLKTIHSQMDGFNSQMQDLTDAVKELKSCEALAHREARSIADYRRDNQDGTVTPVPDAFLIKRHQEELIARANCGLPGR